jgi:hypothetical protein
MIGSISERPEKAHSGLACPREARGDPPTIVKYPDPFVNRYYTLLHLTHRGLFVGCILAISLCPR